MYSLFTVHFANINLFVFKAFCVITAAEVVILSTFCPMKFCSKEKKGKTLRLTLYNNNIFLNVRTVFEYEYFNLNMTRTKSPATVQLFLQLVCLRSRFLRFWCQIKKITSIFPTMKTSKMCAIQLVFYVANVSGVVTTKAHRFLLVFQIVC